MTTAKGPSDLWKSTLSLIYNLKVVVHDYKYIINSALIVINSNAINSAFYW